MKLLIISDLHLEMRPAWQFPPDLPEIDVAVVAGDVHSPLPKSVDAFAKHPALAGKLVILVAGNHEHYGCIFQDNIRDGLDAASGTNVTLLNRSVAVIDGVRFIGATLWTTTPCSARQGTAWSSPATR